MRWGQHNACVKQQPAMWGQAEKSRMKEALEGVLEHIRIMEINSEVFAKEVEPTGLLPMEMTLARYWQTQSGVGCVCVWGGGTGVNWLKAMGWKEQSNLN